ncbi:transposase, partial [bacterium]|nr:transposase [bacterium]
MAVLRCFEQYRPVLEQALALIPARCSVSILADRGFLHHDFIQWAHTAGWSWSVRGKGDTTITLASTAVGSKPAQA